MVAGVEYEPSRLSRRLRKEDVPGVRSHLALTYDGVKLRLYVDGTLATTKYVLAPISQGSGPLTIGCAALGDQHFKGRIDEIRIYNRALDGGEVAIDGGVAIQTPAAAPIAAYPFDENTGTVAGDSSGNLHEGTFSAEGVSWAPGKYGSSLKFDGAKGCLSIPDSQALQLGEEFSLESWVRPEGAMLHYPAIYKESSEGFPSYGLGIGFNTAGKPEGQLGKEGKAHQDLAATASLEPEVWSHLALTYDGVKLRLYVNGELAATKYVERPKPETAGPLTIGCAALGAQHFKGRIDEVRIYNRAIGLGEVVADEGAPIQTPQTGPIAAYSFEEGEGSTVADVAGNQHDGTLSTEGVTWALGKYGKALKFDGAKGCVTIPDAPALQLKEEFTLEAWVRPEGELTRLPIIWKEGGGFPAYDLGIGLTTPGKGEAQIGTTGKSRLTAATPAALEANVWQHLAATFDGSKMRLYLDGELVVIKAVSGTNSAAAGALTIGCGGGWYYRGRIDEAKILNRALTAEEIEGSMLPSSSVVTTEAIGVEGAEAVLIGTVDSKGLPTDYRFEYGPTTSYGTTVPEFNEEELISEVPEDVEEVVEELQPETTYHYRVVGLNAGGRVTGKDQTFATGPSDAQSLAQPAAEKTYPGFTNMMWNGDFAKMGTKSVMNDIEGSGARMLRLVIPGVDAAGHNPQIDKIFRLAAEAHITILPYITQGFYNPTNSQWSAEWTSKVEGVVKRFAKGGTFWTDNSSLPNMAPEWLEVWNEENYGPFNGNFDARAEPKEFGGSPPNRP